MMLLVILTLAYFAIGALVAGLMVWTLSMAARGREKGMPTAHEQSIGGHADDVADTLRPVVGSRWLAVTLVFAALAWPYLAAQMIADMARR